MGDLTWRDAIEEAKSQQAKMMYGRDSWGKGIKEGATKRTSWQGKVILKKGNHVSCVYTVMETVLTAMKLMGFEEHVHVEDIWQMYEWCFIFSNRAMRSGIGGGLFHMGWGDPVLPKNARPGDLAQIQDFSYKSRKYIFGHSVIITGISEQKKGIALNTFSAEPKKGNVEDWRYLVHPNKNVERTWYISRPTWSYDRQPPPRAIDPFLEAVAELEVFDGEGIKGDNGVHSVHTFE